MLARLLLLEALISVAALTACSNSERHPNSPPQTLSPVQSFKSLMIGTFKTAPENTENIIDDKRISFQAPALDGEWFYSQLNTGTDKKLYRQRLNQILPGEDESLILKSYALVSAETYENAWERPQILSKITPEDFKTVFAQTGCDQIWTPDEDGTGWTGKVDPQTCRIFSKRRKTHIYIGADTYISAQRYQTSERGFDETGAQLWGSAPGTLITLYRVNP